MAVSQVGTASLGDRSAALLTARVGEFTRFLIRAERSPATIRTYQWALGDFVDFLLSRRVRGLEELDRATLESCQDRLLACSLKPRSRSLATTGVRGFLKWAADHDYCDPRLKDWLTTVRLPPLQPKPLAPLALATLVAHYSPSAGSRTLPNSLTWLRNRAMFFYFVSTGARVSEALQVPRDHYQRVSVRQKGGTEKVLAIPESVQAIVRDYLLARTDEAGQLFVSHPGARPMTPSGVRAVWQKVARDLRIAALVHTL